MQLDIILKFAVRSHLAFEMMLHLVYRIFMAHNLTEKRKRTRLSPSSPEIHIFDFGKYLSAIAELLHMILRISLNLRSFGISIYYRR